jgi:alcohol dehydrogenase
VKQVWLEHGRVSVRECPAPRGKVLLKLRLGGICNTDLELLRGYYGFRGRPGHEFVAERAATGQRVVGEINLACGKCAWCRRQLGRHCPHRAVLGIVKHPGAFAEYFTLPEANLLPVPGSVSDEHAVFTEPVAAACEILEQAPEIAQGEVAVLGDGKLGLLIAQVLAVSGAKVDLYGRHPAKVRIAQKAGVRGRVGAPLPARRYPFVVEASGAAQGFAQAASMVRPRGVLVLKSTVHERLSIDTAPLVVNEITLIGSRCGRFQPALDLIRKNVLHLDPMLDAEYPLERAPQAFAHAARPGALKVLLRPA